MKNTEREMTVVVYKEKEKIRILENINESI